MSDKKQYSDLKDFLVSNFERAAFKTIFVGAVVGLFRAATSDSTSADAITTGVIMGLGTGVGDYLYEYGKHVKNTGSLTFNQD